MNLKLNDVTVNFQTGGMFSGCTQNQSMIHSFMAPFAVFNGHSIGYPIVSSTLRFCTQFNHYFVSLLSVVLLLDCNFPIVKTGRTAFVGLLAGNSVHAWTQAELMITLNTHTVDIKCKLYREEAATHSIILYYYYILCCGRNSLWVEITFSGDLSSLYFTVLSHPAETLLNK